MKAFLTPVFETARENRHQHCSVPRFCRAQLSQASLPNRICQGKILQSYRLCISLFNHFQLFLASATKFPVRSHTRKLLVTVFSLLWWPARDIAMCRLLKRQAGVFGVVSTDATSVLTHSCQHREPQSLFPAVLDFFFFFSPFIFCFSKDQKLQWRPEQSSWSAWGCAYQPVTVL